MEAQRYQVTQDGKEYILSTNVINNKIIIECQDNNYRPSLTYSREYSLMDLSSFSEIFSLVHSIQQAQNELNNAIERQQVRITNQGKIIEIVFNVQIESYAQELTFQLPIKNSQQITPTTTTQTQISPQVVINMEQPMPQLKKIIQMLLIRQKGQELIYIKHLKLTQGAVVN